MPILSASQKWATIIGKGETRLLAYLRTGKYPQSISVGSAWVKGDAMEWDQASSGARHARPGVFPSANGLPHYGLSAEMGST